MDRLQMQVVNAGVGFCIGFVLGTLLRNRRTGLLLGLVWGGISGVTASQTFDSETEPEPQADASSPRRVADQPAATDD